MRMLEMRGYEVEIVSNGQLLIEKLLEEGRVYDIIVTDYQMPSMDGIQALREIRSMDRFSSLPVIVLTGQGNDPVVNESITNLSATCMSKPFSPRALYAKIEELTKESENK
jgi:two-component system chemotaxis response regulator CheY